MEELLRGAEECTLSQFRELLEQVKSLLQEERRSGETQGYRVRKYLVLLEERCGEALVLSDLHGDLYTLRDVLVRERVLERLGRGDLYLIFLGDYGDRGYYTPEVWYVVLRLKTLYPDHVILLRGNHEFPPELPVYPYDTPLHLYRKFRGVGREEITEVLTLLESLFQDLYLCVQTSSKVLLLHGGPSPLVECPEDVAEAPERYRSESRYMEILEDILWSDPMEEEGVVPNSLRGAGKLFGPSVTEKFLQVFGAEVLVRGHEPVYQGYEIRHRGRLLTIFTRRGSPYHNVRAGYVVLDLGREYRSAEELLKENRIRTIP